MDQNLDQNRFGLEFFKRENKQLNKQRDDETTFKRPQRTKVLNETLRRKPRERLFDSQNNAAGTGGRGAQGQRGTGTGSKTWFEPHFRWISDRRCLRRAWSMKRWKQHIFSSQLIAMLQCYNATSYLLVPFQLFSVNKLWPWDRVNFILIHLYFGISLGQTLLLLIACTCSFALCVCFFSRLVG